MVNFMGQIIYFSDTHNKGKIKRKKPMGITKDKKIEIEREVKRLLKGTDFSQYPSVNITSLVKKDGFEIEIVPMPIETTGCLLVNESEDKPQRLITVNAMFNNPDNEEDVVFKKSRFITAHEYAHFILHKQDKGPLYAHRDTEHRTEPSELEADYFARSILMPYNTFKVCYDVLKEMYTDDEESVVLYLSRMFDATKKKVKLRIQDLQELGSFT